jgi:hypothetical protein
LIACSFPPARIIGERTNQDTSANLLIFLLATIVFEQPNFLFITTPTNTGTFFFKEPKVVKRHFQVAMQSNHDCFLVSIPYLGTRTLRHIEPKVTEICREKFLRRLFAAIITGVIPSSTCGFCTHAFFVWRETDASLRYILHHEVSP